MNMGGESMERRGKRKAATYALDAMKPKTSKSRRIAATASESDNDDVGPINRVVGGKKKSHILDSDCDEESFAGEKVSKLKRKFKAKPDKADVCSGKKNKIKRCVDSSEDDQDVPEATPKEKRLKKLEEMKNKVIAKKSRKKIRYSSSSEASEDEDPEHSADEKDIPEATPKEKRLKKLEEMRNKVVAKKSRKHIQYSSSNGESEEEGPGDSADEDNLPPWENEEAPPEDAKVFDDDTADKEESDLEGFVVSDDNEDHDDNAGKLPDSEDEETSARRKSRTVKKKQKKVGGKDKVVKKRALIEDSEEDGSNSAESEGETDYVNPYMEEKDDGDILARLRRDTKNDRKNKKNYKRQLGEYQFACHSDRNKAAAMSEQKRFAKTMETAKFDMGLKQDRNLDWGDSEFYEYKEVHEYGEALRLYPHTRRVTNYSARCALSGCKERFLAGETKIIGAMKLDPFSCRFVKKTSNWTGKQCFFYVCGEHYPKDGDSSDEEWPAGDSDDQMEEDSEGEKEGSSKKESKGSSEDEPEENSDGSESED